MVSECMMLFEYELKIGTLFSNLETSEVLSKKQYILRSARDEKKALALITCL